MKNIKNFLSTLCIMMSVVILSPVSAGETEYKSQKDVQITEFSDNGHARGKASFYGGKYHHGKKMANGKIFDKNKLTCAHPTHPFGTKLLVTNVKNGKSVTVTVTDRGGFQKLGRIIDLSEGAFKQIASLKTGVITVKIEKL